MCPALIGVAISWPESQIVRDKSADLVRLTAKRQKYEAGFLL